MTENTDIYDLIPCEICHNNVPFEEYSQHLAMCSYRSTPRINQYNMM